MRSSENIVPCSVNGDGNECLPCLVCLILNPICISSGAFFSFPINTADLEHTVKFQTPFINQALTKPALPGGLEISLASLILLPSLRAEPCCTVLPGSKHHACSFSSQPESYSPSCLLPPFPSQGTGSLALQREVCWVFLQSLSEASF